MTGEQTDEFRQWLTKQIEEHTSQYRLMQLPQSKFGWKFFEEVLLKFDESRTRRNSMTSLLDAVDLELLTLAMASLPEEWQDEGTALMQKINTIIAKGELMEIIQPHPVVPCTCERQFHQPTVSIGRED